MLLRVAEVERVHDHADVGGVLAGLAHVRDLDQLESRLVHRALVVLVALPVAVGLLDDDVALEQQPLEHFSDVKGGDLHVAHAERDVLEVAEHGHDAGVGPWGGVHSSPAAGFQAVASSCCLRGGTGS